MNRITQCVNGFKGIVGCGLGVEDDRPLRQAVGALAGLRDRYDARSSCDGLLDISGALSRCDHAGGIGEAARKMRRQCLITG